MSIITRTRQALERIFSGGPTGFKTVPYLWNYAKDTPIWSMVDYMSFARQGYERNPLLYRAIMYKVQAANTTRLRAYEGDEQNMTPLPANHPLAQLLKRPNTWQSWAEFEAQNLAYLDLHGNSYIYLDRETPGGVPVAMYSLRPDRVQIIPGKNEIRGFLYIPPGKTRKDAVPFLVEDVIHTKYPNPADDLEGLGYGVSPLAPAAQAIEVDNNATDYIKLWWERGTILSGLLKFTVPLDDTTVQTIRRRWVDRYGGQGAWGEVGVLDSGGDYKPLGTTFKDMDFSALDERAESRILLAIGVPGILLDTRSGMKNSTYANKAEARRAFWEDTMLYVLSLFDNEYEHYLGGEGIVIQRDYSRVPALQRNLPELVQAAKTMWDMGVPADVAFRSMGVPVEATPGSDIGYVNGVPVGGAAEAEETTDAGKSLAARAARRGRKAGGWNDEQKFLHWKAVDNIAHSHEQAFAGAAEAGFEQDRRAMLALVTETGEKARRRKSTVDWLWMAAGVDRHFTEVSPGVWRGSFAPLMRAVVADTGEYWGTTLGFAFDVQNVLGQAWFADYTLRFAQPISATSANSIQALLALAQQEGWSTDTMTNRMGSLFEQWITGDLSPEDFAWLATRLPPHRRELIARTETTRLQNRGAWELFRGWEIEKKEWISTKDDRTRREVRR